MATIRDLVAGIEVELEAATKRGVKAIAEQKLILDTVNQEGRAEFSPDETARFDELDSNIQLAKAQEDGIKTRLARAKKVEAEELDAEQRSGQAKPTNAGERAKIPFEQHVSVGREERTYHKGNDPYGKNFLKDVVRQFVSNDVGSVSRLSRHMQEERVEHAQYLQRAAGDTTTVNWAGLTVPQYLTDFVAPYIAGLRPFADVCNKHPLPPEGMSVNFSRVTTPSSVAQQSAELALVSTTSVDDTLGSANVLTAAGSQNVSRQAIDRGTHIDDTVLQDLFSRYATDLDSNLVNMTTYGLTDVCGSVDASYVEANPTAELLYSKIQGAAASVETHMLAMGPPSHVVMHPRRWYYLSGALTSSWPLINSQPMSDQAGGVGFNQAYNTGVRGVLPNGLQVIGDANVSTTLGGGTEDEIYVLPQREAHLWEDPGAPAFIRAEQPTAANLGVLLVVYGYYAFAFNRYANGMQKISGTGLIAPTF